EAGLSLTSNAWRATGTNRRSASTIETLMCRTLVACVGLPWIAASAIHAKATARAITPSSPPDAVLSIGDEQSRYHRRMLKNLMAAGLGFATVLLNTVAAQPPDVSLSPERWAG